MRIGLTYDLQTDPTDERQAEFDSPATITALTGALEHLGHDLRLLGNAQALLARPEPLENMELIFNIAEGYSGRCREAWVPTILDLHGIPYVGSDPLALMLGLDKAVTKRLAAAVGVPTPRWVNVAHPRAVPDPLPLDFPVIVKPRWEGSGRGIDPDAVVHNPRALAERIAFTYQRCPEPLLIEECISGGELTVLVIGNDPPKAYPAIQRTIDQVSRLSCHVVDRSQARPICPITLDPQLEAQAREISLKMFEAVGCRDVARVDLRVDDAGQVYFLEINPLPSYDPQIGFGLLAEYLGLSYADLIGGILRATLVRLEREPQPFQA